MLAFSGELLAQSDLENFVKNFQKTILKGAFYKVNQKDLANGYIYICVPPQSEKECGMDSDLYTITMWKTAKGTSIFGTFKHGCGGMGCWGSSMESLVFYDEKMQNITSKLCNIPEIQKIADTIDLKNAEVSSVDAEQRNVYVEIPQKGTTIQLTVGLAGVVSKNFAELQFDKNSGTFKFVTK
jgi:hypothetical protein